MTADLDLNDLDEVRRRVVDPVLAAMVRPEELVSAELVVAQDWPDTDNVAWAWKRWPNNPDADRPGDEPNDLFVVLEAVDGEEHTARLGTLGFYRYDTEDLASELEESLRDWICETRFGWGDLRFAEDLRIPPAHPDPEGRPIVGLWVGYETVELLVDDLAVDPASLGLSDSLISDLSALQAEYSAWADADEAEEQRRYEETMAQAPFGFSVSYIDASKADEELAAVRAAREQAHLGKWRQFVAEMEPRRDSLLTRLQLELGDAYRVPLPARVL